MRFRAVFYLILLIFMRPPVTLANDTSVELAVGGITYTQSPDVSMEQEVLTITPEKVTVLYHFLNLSPSPVTLTVGFPLPELDLADQDVNYAIPGSDPVNFVDFQTKVDGKPIKFDVIQKARLGGKDITGILRDANLPIAMLGLDAQSHITQLAPDVRERLIKDGILIPLGTDEKGAQLYGPGWLVSTTFTRKQVFPPGQTVVVEHRYKTSLGASQDTVLRKALRNGDGMAPAVERYIKDYCLAQDFLPGLDKLAGADPANTGKLQERRIAYVLKTGANWSGPIKNFKLIVDKGRPDRLVSFCFENVKKISATTFEADYENFTPKQDLKILLIGKY